MYDYMKTLWDKFAARPDISAVQLDIDTLHHQLIDELSKEQRRKLLTLINKEDELCDEVSLHSFIAGFRVAFGLTAELNLTEPYSFEKDEEQRSMALSIMKEGNCNGEETS